MKIKRSPSRQAIGALAAVAALTWAALAIPASSTTIASDPVGAVQGRDTLDGVEPDVSFAGATTPATGFEEGSYEVTLITGDRVRVIRGPLDQFSAEATPVPRPDGSTPQIQVTNMGEPDSLYALPDDVLPFITAGLVDKALFDVRYLATHGYTDRSDQLPVIVDFAGRLDSAAVTRRADQLPASRRSSTLQSIDAAAVSVDKNNTTRLWQSLVGADQTADEGSTADLAAGVRGVWLDRKVQVTLDESVPQIGAPQAWEAGYDGTGTTVAVLDTGIDASHPDLQGTVSASKSFVPGVDSVADGNGHGTHVASTIVGTGAASDGQYKGVAPGADLAVGKVLDDTGSGTFSQIIEGMQWATQEQDADIVSMSLGCGPSDGCTFNDGTDPLSQAVNQLTASTGTLFVIAAGNAGSNDFTVGTPGVADAALTVGAVDKSDQLAGFSSRGPRHGDYGIKPEITAPGVHITAARAAGTSLCANATCGDPADGPVDDFHSQLSGTSMATPHVAGAAAILKQQHPAWDAGQLKAALVASAKDGGYSVYEQGAGRVDISQAIAQQVQVSPATADFGFSRLPIEGSPVVIKTLTYTNPTSEPIALDLALAVRTDEGDPVADQLFNLDHDTLTVPANGNATATVAFDRTAVESAIFSGSVVATDPVTGTRLTTPVGAVIGEQLHELTIRQIHSGKPPNWDPSPSVYIMPVDTTESLGDWTLVGDFGDVPVDDWEQGGTALLPAGTYMVATFRGALWYDPATGQQQQGQLVDPEVTLPGDSEVTLDAADAVKPTFDTPRPTQAYQSRRVMQRWVPDHVADGGYFWLQYSIPDHVDPDRFWVTPTEQVKTGEFSFTMETTRVAPWLSMTAETSSAEPIALHAQYPAWGAPLISFTDGSINVSRPTINGGPAGSAPGPVVANGGQVTVAVTVTNTSSGGNAVTDLTGSSPPFGELSCAKTTLQRGESTTCAAQGVAANGSQVVPLHVVGQVAAGRQVLVGGASVAYYVGAADPTQPPPTTGLNLGIGQPTVSGLAAGSVPGPQIETGTDLTIQVTATNTGSAPVTDLAGTSPIGDLRCVRSALDPGERTTCDVESTATEGVNAIPVTIQGRGSQGEQAAGAVIALYIGRPKPAMFAGRQTLDMIDAGARTADEIAQMDIAGKLVMLRHEPADPGIGGTRCFAEKPEVDAAVNGGAAGLILAQNEDVTNVVGNLACNLPPAMANNTPWRSIDDAVGRIPIVYVPFTDAELLRDRLSQGKVRIAVEGRPQTPYIYQLSPREDGRIRDSLHYTFTDRDLATIDHQLHANRRGSYGMSITTWRPSEAGISVRGDLGIRALPSLSTTAPWKVTEYYGPLDEDVVVRHEVIDYTSSAGRQVRYDILDEPTHLTMRWNDSPPVPAVTPALAGSVPWGLSNRRFGGLPLEMANCSGCREGNMFWPALRFSASSDPQQIGWTNLPVTLTQLRGDPDVHLYRNGEEVPQAGDPYFDTLLGYELPPESGTYRLTDRIGHTSTEWEFTSSEVSRETVDDRYTCHLDWLERYAELPRSDTPCRPEPLIFLRYNLGDSLGLDNTVPKSGTHRFNVTAYNGQSTDPMPRIQGLKLWTSTDGGQTWRQAKVEPQRQRGTERQFEVTAVYPKLGDGTVSLKTEAWDVDGNRVTQVIHQAFDLKR